jgi:hypothetical protein
MLRHRRTLVPDLIGDDPAIHLSKKMDTRVICAKTRFAL